MRPQNKPIGMDDLQTSEREASLEETLKARRMNYFVEQMPAEDMMKLWKGLQASVKAAQPGILLDLWASGTILNRDFRAVVTACTTADGFVLTFTVGGTSK
jgi:hypothetical protein